MQGAFYEPLIVVPAGGAKTVPWLARSWKWRNGNKTLTCTSRRTPSGRTASALTSADVVYSLTAGRQDKTMDRIGLTGADNNVASIKAKGHITVVIKLKTPDSQFIPATLNRVVRRPEARLGEGQGSGDVHELEPRQLRPVQPDRALHDAGLRPEQEPELLAEGPAEGRVPRVRAGGVERRRRSR